MSLSANTIRPLDWCPPNEVRAGNPGSISSEEEVSPRKSTPVATEFHVTKPITVRLLTGPQG